MYMNQMIAQVPSTKPYSKRHLESVEQLLRLINEVLTMAPEFGPQGAMVATPLAAILDWTMGTPAGFAAFRDPRINAMLKKILTVWCEFLSSGDSLYVLNDSPSGWKSAEAQRTVGIEQYEHDPRGRALGLLLVERLLHPTLQGRRASGRLARRRQGDRQRMRVDALRHQHRRAAPGSLLDQEPAVFARGHAGQRRVGRRVRRRHRLSGVPERHQLPPLAQPRRRQDRPGVRPARAPTTPRPTPRARTRSSRRTRSPTWRTSPRGRSS